MINLNELSAVPALTVGGHNVWGSSLLKCDNEERRDGRSGVGTYVMRAFTDRALYVAAALVWYTNYSDMPPMAAADTSVCGKY